MFQLNVKGITQSTSALSGTITAVANGTAGKMSLIAQSLHV